MIHYLLGHTAYPGVEDCRTTLFFHYHYTAQRKMSCALEVKESVDNTLSVGPCSFCFLPGAIVQHRGQAILKFAIKIKDSLCVFSGFI